MLVEGAGEVQLGAGGGCPFEPRHGVPPHGDAAGEPAGDGGKAGGEGLLSAQPGAHPGAAAGHCGCSALTE